MISVILPVYNVRPYLEEAVESVLRQSFRDLEIILVDDGSTDGSGELCDGYLSRDSRIRVIHQENRGLSCARNAGLDVCTGELIAFLDPDDAFFPNALEKMSEALLSSGADIAECNFVSLAAEGPMDCASLEKKEKAFCPEKDRTGLYSRCQALPMQCGGEISNFAWNKLYRREIWTALRYPEGQNYEDIDVILPLLSEAGSIFILDEKLVIHRLRNGSISFTRTFRNVRDHVLANRHYTEYVQAHIPEYFTPDTLTRLLRKRAGLLFSEFYACADSRMEEKDACLDYLRGEISELSRRIDPRSCGTRVRAAYFLYRRASLPLSLLVYRAFALLRSAGRGPKKSGLPEKREEEETL